MSDLTERSSERDGFVTLKKKKKKNKGCTNTVYFKKLLTDLIF